MIFWFTLSVWRSDVDGVIYSESTSLKIFILSIICTSDQNKDQSSFYLFKKCLVFVCCSLCMVKKKSQKASITTVYSPLFTAQFLYISSDSTCKHTHSY